MKDLFDYKGYRTEALVYWKNVHTFYQPDTGPSI